MRLGLVTDFYYPWIGGPARLVHALAHGLADRGHDVFVLAPSPTGPARTEQDGVVAIRRCASLPLPFGYGVRVTQPVGSVSRWLREVDPDVVHVHHPFPLSASTIFAARRRGIPVVATNHTIPECSLWGLRGTGPLYSAAERGFGWWLKLLLSRCDVVTTPTEMAAAALRDLGFNRVVTPISNGVDTNRFSPALPSERLRERLRLDDRPVVLYTGRLDAEKEVDVWLRAASNLTSDVQLVIGGEGTAKPALQRLARELGIESAVHFIGYLSEDELPDLYRLADIYFITSPVELQSISTLEAVSSGLPVVGVTAGALPELVRNEENGLLVPPGGWRPAASALDRLIADASLRQRMGQRSRELALAHDFQRTLDAYEKLLIDAGAQRGGERRLEQATIART